MKRRSYFFLLFFLYGLHLFSQNDVKDVRIMVVPYVQSGEDIRTIIQKDNNVRIALTKVKEFLISNGFTTVDYEAKLKKAKQDGLFKEIDNSPSAKSAFLKYSGTDIYLDLEFKYESSATGNNVRMIINGYSTVTANSFATLICTSPKYKSDDVGGLILRGLKGCKEEFVNSISAGINDIKDNGRSLQLHFTIDNSAPFDFNTGFSDGTETDVPLKDLIELWIADHQQINYYGSIKSFDREIIYGEIRTNFQDKSGKRLQPSRIILRLKSYLRKLNNPGNAITGLNIKEDVINGTRYLRLSSK